MCCYDVSGESYCSVVKQRVACLQACTSLQELRLGDAPGFCHADVATWPAVRPADVAAFKADMPFLHTLELGSNQVDSSVCQLRLKPPCSLAACITMANHSCDSCCASPTATP